MKLLVQFPGQVSKVMLKVEPETFEGLLDAVSAHKHTKNGKVKELWYYHTMHDDSKQPVEIDDLTFQDLCPKQDVVNVVLKGGDTVSTQPLPIIPRLVLDKEQLEKFKPTTLSGEQSSNSITDPEQALSFLEKSQGFMEAIKVPRFLRSISCSHPMEEVWQYLRSCMTKDGFVSHRDVADLIKNGLQPLAPVTDCTPRTTFTVKDQLPLGASAVSPLPAGKTINDLIASLDKISSAGSNASFRTVSNDTQRPTQNIKIPDLRTHLLTILEGQTDTLPQASLPAVLKTLNIVCDPDTVERTLATLRICKGRRLSRRDLCMILSRLQEIPSEEVIPQMKTRLKRSSVLSSSLPKRSVNGMTDSLASNHTGAKSTPHRCGLCGKHVSVSDKLMCGGCRVTSYCSSTCLNEDWQGHQPICDAIVQHHNSKKLTVQACSQGVTFPVYLCPTTDDPGKYVFIVTQRVPVLHKTFLLFSSIRGSCEYSYPPLGTAPPGEAAIHSLIKDILASVYEASLEKGIWVLSACCLGPLRSYRCSEGDFESLISDYRRYHAVFLSPACKETACESIVRYELVVPFMVTLCEVFESKALQVHDDAKEFVYAVGQAKNYYLSLLAYLQDTAFCKEAVSRASHDRREVMKKISVVYQHLAARDKEGKALSYLERSEAVLLRLTAENPTTVNYNLLGLLYDCLPHDAAYRSKAVCARQKAAELSCVQPAAGKGKEIKMDNKNEEEEQEEEKEEHNGHNEGVLAC
eukprot:TRINITY_DN1333_c1_g2_i1.p1 TRINITY_DN1333_c1_g2~~TRINITY_DN1333_c1_g2_i1.p1  ORF type:complete len:787 (+),score=68.83 TRINITY_DN1333_c1_g2_i1:121-2361(+)